MAESKSAKKEPNSVQQQISKAENVCSSWKAKVLACTARSKNSLSSSYAAAKKPVLIYTSQLSAFVSKYYVRSPVTNVWG